MSTPDLYVRLLVNEKPMKMGLCREGSGYGGGSDGGVAEWAESQHLCRLQVLGDGAYNMTKGFSSLSELCKAT